MCSATFAAALTRVTQALTCMVVNILCPQHLLHGGSSTFVLQAHLSQLLPHVWRGRLQTQHSTFKQTHRAQLVHWHSKSAIVRCTAVASNL
jgi:hypothetical protein